MMTINNSNNPTGNEPANDETYMRRAIELAALGRFTTSPNPNVGCVIVKEGKIIGEGYHHHAGGPHAEVNALNMAGENAKGATVYVTLEPCSHFGKTPPCADALINAGVKRVVAAMQDPNPQVAGRGLHKLVAAGIDVSHGVLMQEAEKLNIGFFKRMRTGFPYIQLKLAASLDGKTALASGESQWITSNASRQDVQNFRAQASAILTTSATVLADDPAMNVRWEALSDEIKAIYPLESLRQPIRIITDSQNRVTPDYKITQLAGECLLARTHSQQEDWQGDVSEIFLPTNGKNSSVDLVLLMMQLGKRNINSVWVESGAHFAGALLELGLVDELIIYIAPKILGNDARGLLSISPLSSLSEAPEFTIDSLQQIGPDIRVCLKPRY
ncbi:TPA: bifunctional diaminohydroxyphosphoribosylaminopyrimidine deaminase/5-amino-6-(5-phosphoribosylamino)uracil reductase RibD [Proteus mirabilis]|uniref:bifunctional diaminohydroxyphosphoribosylaminopyrimidine deaminase/5-amino-6-(5-phosphoribosylamino)uracil reductase RibD n=1 Tax=Proteus mirabilis TaxID=584 RepID=UPI00228D1872|nr:bifunctional diaminohydroxyphosphoribosylaminopyrimidine deaminase/5-amino-6-(5-phosphoribosylamino)uracil reductase RibD [Proteus mirabilis]MDM3704849.1 bifunctional diaminohydroxyphosphoribosylaminopyrimidine deaminase/5-amino-6-(5-phosphoribosylamino)uracil reductase RibD [Proteus mirabilis]MDM3719959.1 bifunctional diaminohydroxyphosphoribosylaminopyrimidine deaminase/5-amino-6-(5-phosphoribosylamino)uracil reductase RibD [Proteus mirabilis]HCT1987067.1 bifunctional diaminohydroxyphosphor